MFENEDELVNFLKTIGSEHCWTEFKVVFKLSGNSIAMDLIKLKVLGERE